jgi:hypothetical protein
MRIFQHSDDEKSRSRLTLVIYLSVIAAAVFAAAYAGRYVIFRPWTSRTRVAAAVHGDTVFVAGGLDQKNAARDEIMAIDVSRESLRRAAKLPSPRFGTALAAAGDSLYIFGGYDGRTYLDEIVRFRIPSREIRVVAKLPGPRAFGAAAHWETGVYYFGGWDGGKITDQILRFDLVDREVTVAGYLPEPLEYVHGVTVDDTILLFGGEDRRLSWREEIIEFDPSNGSLRYRASIPSTGSAIQAVLKGDSIIAKLSPADSRQEVLYRIDAERGGVLVEPLFALPEKSVGLTLLSAQDKAYLIGGAEEQFGRHIGIYEIDFGGGAGSDSPTGLGTGRLIPVKLKSFVWR